MGEVVTDPFRAARLILTLRRVGVTDNTVLAAMEQVPRDQFVDEDAADLAFEDAVLPIACGQTILRPSVTGQLLQMAEFRGPVPRVLLIGLGAGYTAALLSHLAADVFAVERYRRLFDTASETLQRLEITNVHTRHGDGLVGWTEMGPFDRIILTGVTDPSSETLLQQLTDDGRLIQPLSTETGQKIKVLDKQGKILNSQDITGFQPLAYGPAQEL